MKTATAIQGLPEASSQWSKLFIKAVIKDLEGSLEKEKQQIVDAWENGDSSIETTTGEGYYNKTYNP